MTTITLNELDAGSQNFGVQLEKLLAWDEAVNFDIHRQVLDIDPVRTAAVFDRKIQDQDEQRDGEEHRYGHQKPVQGVDRAGKGRGLLRREAKIGTHSRC